MSDEPTPVSEWIAALKQGDPEAAAALWRGYWERLVRLAGRRLRGDRRRGVEDEEDLAQSAFACLCRGAADGRFDRLANRNDLWRLLIAITRNKARDRARHHRRRRRGGGRAVLGESALADQGDDRLPSALAEILSTEPDPEVAAEAAEGCRMLLEALADDELRRIAVWRLEGRSNAEVAALLGRSERSVERKLERIRLTWVERACDGPPEDRTLHRNGSGES